MVRIIGVTGGVGTGKSTVLHILKTEYSAYIVEADKVAHMLMQPGGVTYQPIIETFGDGILDDEGNIDRAVLGSIVFSDEKKLEQLNHITHPSVRAYILDRIEAVRNTNPEGLFIIEAALLIETGYREICDEIWYIYAREDVRIERLMSARGYSYEKCISIMENQSSEAFFRDNSQKVIDNSLDFKFTKQQIDNLLKK